jgi:hypothetical protein
MASTSANSSNVMELDDRDDQQQTVEIGNIPRLKKVLAVAADCFRQVCSTRMKGE